MSCFWIAMDIICTNLLSRCQDVGDLEDDTQNVKDTLGRADAL